MATPLRRKVYTHQIESGEIPEEVREALELLGGESHLGIKGGHAKTVMEEILRQQGKNPKSRSRPSGIGMDLDIVLTFVGTRKKSIDMLDERVRELTEKLLETGIELNPADVETLKGNLSSEKILQRFLESRDVTINESILVPKQGEWCLFYTDKCFRDTLNGIGILAANGSGTTRIDAGRKIAGPLGIVRLLRFLIEGKVNRIYLPQWWIDLNNKEAKRMHRESLGGYGPILGRRYRGKPVLEEKMMLYLNKLGLTDIRNFERYMEEQEIFFQFHTGNKFSFNDKRSFREIQEHFMRKEEERTTSYQERKTARDICSHETVSTFVCGYCPRKCLIKKCADCTAFEVIPENSPIPVSPAELLCSHNFKTASVYWDEQGFFPRRRNNNAHKHNEKRRNNRNS